MTVDTIGGVGIGRAVKRRVDAILNTRAMRTLLVNNRVAIVVANGHTNRRGVNVAVTPNEKSTEDGLGDEVKNTVEDGFRVGRDDVAALAKTPGDGVQDPEEGGERAADGEALADLGTVARSVAAGLEDELIDDVEEGDAA